MEVLEEIRTAARKILARHGMADHKCAVSLYKKRGINPHENTVNAVCEHFGISMEELRSESRKQPNALIRQILCYLLFCESGLNMFAIGDIVNRDRTTVVYSVKTIKNLLTYNSRLRDEIELLTAAVNNYIPKVNNTRESTV